VGGSKKTWGYMNMASQCLPQVMTWAWNMRGSYQSTVKAAAK